MAGHIDILTNKRGGTLQVGVTGDLARRIPGHKTRASPGFAVRYGCRRLVRSEEHFDMRDALAREKRIKRRPRRWKIELVKSVNPDWNERSVGFGWQKG